MDGEMKKVIGFTVLGLILFMGFLFFMMAYGEQSDPYCEEETQFVSDEDWRQLCGK